MGLFKKIFKGIKKVFKKIGKGIKSVFKKIGKFMGKIGIIGQIGLSLILPGIGGMIGNLAQSMLAVGNNALVRGAGHFLRAAVNVGSQVKGMVKTVTDGVTKVVGNVAGTVLNKIPGATDLVKDVTGRLGINSGKGLNMANASFDKALEAAQSAVTDFASQGRDLFSMDTLTSDKYISASTKAAINNAKTDAIQGSPEDLMKPSTSDHPFSAPSLDEINANIIKDTPTALKGPEALMAPQTTGHPFSSPSQAAAQTAREVAQTAVTEPSFGEKVVEYGRKAIDSGLEKFGEKIQTIKDDPYEAIKLGFKTYEQVTEEEKAMALQQAALAGEVINVGQYQDPSAFLAYGAQNTVPPLAEFQEPTSYFEPISNWGKQFTFDPFNLQTTRGMG